MSPLCLAHLPSGFLGMMRPSPSVVHGIQDVLRRGLPRRASAILRRRSASRAFVLALSRMASPVSAMTSLCNRLVPSVALSTFNNAAEPALRHGVLWRKMSHGPKSVKGSEYLACIWSVVETCRQQGRSVWDFLTDCMAAAAEGQVLPSLLTLPSDVHAA